MPLLDVMTSNEIISYIQANPNLALSDLQDLVRRADVSGAAGDIVTILYSGGIDTTGGTESAWKTAVGLAEQHSDLGIIDNTEAGKLLTNLTFRESLKNAIANANPSLSTAQIEALAETELFKPKGGLWSISSANLASQASGDIIVIVSHDVDLNRTFATVELPKLLENPAVKTINGIDKFALNEVYIAKGLEAAMDHVVLKGGAMLSTLEEGIDALGNKVYKTNIFLENIEHVVGEDFPDGTTNITSFAERFRAGGQYAAWLDGVKSGAFDFSIHGSAIKFGIAATILDIAITSSKAEAAHAVGNDAGAAHIIAEWASSIAGGVFIGAKIFSFFTPVGAVTTIMWGIASAYMGSETAKVIYNIGEKAGIFLTTAAVDLGDALERAWHELPLQAAELSDIIASGTHIFFDAVAAAIVAPRTDPLIIDLAGNGIVLDSWQNSNALFDLNNDGTPENTGWTTVNSDDSFLVIDKNSNGNIDDITEMFGNATVPGFVELKKYDSNGDNLINSTDSQFNLLRLWNDTNGNGIVDAVNDNQPKLKMVA